MPATAYSLQIVTPEGIAFAGEVRSVVLPGADGSFGIMAQHAPLLSALLPGVLHLEDAGGTKREMAVGEGFVEVLAEGTKVLTDFVNDAASIDRDRAEAARDRAQQRLDPGADPTVDHQRAEASLRRAILRLQVADTAR